MAGGHAYTTLGTTTVTKDGNEVRLVKVRNPWGAEDYNGPWSDNSNLWTPELRTQVQGASGDADISNEGIFYMDITTYRTNFK